MLKEDELLWFQRSREEWLVSGDKNIKFYHASTQVRKNRHKIQALKNPNQDWITNTTQLENMVYELYMQLFRNDNICNRVKPNLANCPKHTEVQKQSLAIRLSLEEVKQTFFDMAPFKSPREDGFHATFYQNMWEVMGNLCTVL